MLLINNNSQAFGETYIRKRKLANIEPIARRTFERTVINMQRRLEYPTEGINVPISPIADSEGHICGAEISATSQARGIKTFVIETIDSMKNKPMLSKTIPAQNGEILPKQLENAIIAVSKVCRNCFNIKHRVY